MHSTDRAPSTTDVEIQPGPGRLVVRLAATLLCLGLVGWNAMELRNWTHHRDSLTELLVDLGLEEFNQTALRRISRERASHQADLIAARAIVHQVMSPDLDERGFPIIGKDQRLAALDQAEALARQALRAESESWQASMLIGASIYLRRSLSADRRLITEAADWEDPLKKSVGAAASKTEPRRILAAAYLETWAYLSPEKKDLTRQLLTQVFQNDERALRRLVPLWLQLAEDEGEAMSVVPPTADAWQFVKFTYGQAKRWSSYARAQQGLFDALEVELAAQLDEAEQRARLGDEDTSRQLCLTVVQRAPRQLRFVPFVIRALEIFPPGLQNGRSNDGPAAWLRWAVDMDVVSINPLPPTVVDGLMAISGGGLEASVAAHAALLADNAYNVGRFEKQVAFKSNLEWAPFLVAKARRLVDLEVTDLAQESLDELDLASQNSYGAWQVRARIAEAQEDLDLLAQAQGEMKAHEDFRWTALDWDLRQDSPTLFLVAAAEGRGLRLEIVETAAQGDAVEVHLDGRLVALRSKISGQQYDLDVEITAGPHVLQVVSASRQKVIPGSVTLLQ